MFYDFLFRENYKINLKMFYSINKIGEGKNKNIKHRKQIFKNLHLELIGFCVNIINFSYKNKNILNFHKGD